MLNRSLCIGWHYCGHESSNLFFFCCSLVSVLPPSEAPVLVSPLQRLRGTAGSLSVLEPDQRVSCSRRFATAASPIIQHYRHIFLREIPMITATGTYIRDTPSMRAVYTSSSHSQEVTKTSNQSLTLISVLLKKIPADRGFRWPVQFKNPTKILCNCHDVKFRSEIKTAVPPPGCRGHSRDPYQLPGDVSTPNYVSAPWGLSSLVLN